MVEEVKVSRIFIAGLQEEIKQLKERNEQLEAELAFEKSQKQVLRQQ